LLSCVALLAIWLTARLVKKIDPKFSENVKVWRTMLAFGGAELAALLKEYCGRGRSACPVR
jgi:hypothetical protein